MKKYYPVDFDEKGNAVLGNAKSNPTSNGFIPTAWAPGGSDEEKQGLKSITISPAITTTPALDSLFPIYWGDTYPPAVHLVPTGELPASAEITITPTSDWYAFDNGSVGGKGEPITITVENEDDSLYCRVSVLEDPSEEQTKFVSFDFAIE